MILLASSCSNAVLWSLEARPDIYRNLLDFILRTVSRKQRFIQIFTTIFDLPKQVPRPNKTPSTKTTKCLPPSS